MTRWMGIDHGTVRIGVAVGDTDGKIASPVAVLDASPHPQAVEEIGRLAEEYDVAGLVVGWPLNMDGSIGPMAEAARDFAGELARATGRDVRLWDERLSSFQADAALAGTLTRKKRRARQDAIAAADFLADFLQSDGPDRAPRPSEADRPDLPM